MNYYRNYVLRLSDWLSPFFKHLKETSKFYVPTNLVDDFTELNKILENSSQLAFRQPLEDEQLHLENKQSSGMFEEEQMYMLPDDELDENQLWEKIKIHEVKHKTKLNDPANFPTELQHIHKPISGLNTCSEGRY